MLSTPQKIDLPSPVSALAFNSPTALYAGSQDGTVRLYNLPSPRVVQAIKLLGSEVSSIACVRKQDDSSDIWIASGCRALLFSGSTSKMIQSLDDVTASLAIGEDDEDVLNELDLSDKSKYLAFSSDAGGVGVVDLSNHSIHRMKVRHNNICGTVRFIPDRPNELVSGGYDSALLHFDLNQRILLSRHDITAPPESTGGVSLSPPFVLSMAVSSTALIAVGTANGQLWLGGGGEKRPDSSANKKKRSRKWEGLREDDSLSIAVADGPVVAVAFSDSNTVLTCSLLGSLVAHTISRNSEGRLQADRAWSTNTSFVKKVNAMSITENWLAVGGINSDGKGVIEAFKINNQPPSGNIS